MTANIIAIGAASMAIYLLLNVLIGKLLLRYIYENGIEVSRRYAFWAVYFLLAFSYPAESASRGIVPPQMSVVLSYVSGYYMMAFLYFALLAIGFSIMFFLTRILLRRDIDSGAYIKRYGTVSILTVILAGAYGGYRTGDIVTTEYTVDVDKEYRQGDLKIVFVSDLHLGRIVGDERLDELVRRINKQNPDLVLFGGDIIDDDFELFQEKGWTNKFNEIKSKYGVYGVLGNHEYISGKENEFIKEMKSSSVMKILRDEVVETADIYIVGRDDLTSDAFGGETRSSMESLSSGIDKRKPTVVIDHQLPFRIDGDDIAGDVYLTGHTHYGQVFPLNWIMHLTNDIAYGQKKIGDANAIVSSGYGTWGPPARIGTDSEIVVVNLKLN